MADAQSAPDVTQLVTQYHQAVYQYAYRLTGSVQDAEDLTQQAFLAAQRKMGQLRNIENAKAWLFAILRNGFLKDRQRRWPALAADLPLNIESVQSSPIEEGVDRDRLQDALNRLPEASRLVLMMFYFEQCSYREIARRLEMPIGTVMSRLARAKDYLRTILLELEHGRRKRPAHVAADQAVKQ
jgi:RNA polymerase sigma-70 factor, ECF subfamily